ncbi:uncharacterized protein ACNS7B_016248 [Menidia menidia]
MGGGGSVSNNTPYDWVFDRGRQVSTDVCTLRRNSTKEYSEEFIYNHQLWFRFEDHSNWDLKCWGRGDSFTIRESSDRKYFELVNNSSRQVVDKCPHFGRIEEEKQERKRREREEKRRRKEEEKRRQAELERMRRIQEEMEERKRQERIQKEEQRRREEEEKRRQEKLERMRRIQEQIEERRRQEEQRRREEEEKRRQETLERMRRIQKEIEERRRQEEQRRREEEEKRCQEKLERMRRIQEEIEERKRQERIQKEEQRRREEEEKRRQAELERMRRIQEHIEIKRKHLERREQEVQQRERLDRMRIQMQMQKESEASRRKLSAAQERLQMQPLTLTQTLTLTLTLQQQALVLLQPLEDHSAHTHRDQVGEVKEQFEELLSAYQITENEGVETDLEDRMKTLQNELTLRYFRQHNIPIWPQWALDQATGYVELSLTEKISVLEAVLKATLGAEPESQEGPDKKVAFLLRLQDQLHARNPTLARKVLVNVLDLTSQLPKASKEILSRILFNNVWTPKEIRLFMGSARGTDPHRVTQVLHSACTHRLSCLRALAALRDTDPVGHIQAWASRQEDKDAAAIVAEMQDKNCPPHILSLLEALLTHVEEELPRHTTARMSPERARDWRRGVASLDLADPNPAALREVLVGLCIAVKTCTAFTASGGEPVPGYFPRLTQMAALVLLLLPQVQDRKGCLLEMGTGEGKTCLLAMFATVQAARGAAVDVVTSSPLLAIRDQQEWEGLYRLLGVTSSPVPPPRLDGGSFGQQDELLQEAYRQQVVYGTAGTFAADILRQEFEKKTTRGRRGFECVVVDEVDYMTLDSGVQVTFLSHQASSLRHLEQVLSGVWALLSACRPLELLEPGELRWAARIQPFHSTLKQAGIGPQAWSEHDILALGVRLGLYPQEDLDQLQEAQGLYPQEDLDQLQEAQGLYPQEDLDRLKKTQSLGLYPQEDLDQLKKTQSLGLYPQEDLDQLQEAQDLGLYPQEDLDRLKKTQGLDPQEDLDQLKKTQSLGLYPQEDLDQLKKTQSLGLYPQEDLDQLQEAQDLGLYPQEDLDQLKKIQGLYPQEDLDQLQEGQDLGLYPQEDLDQLKKTQSLGLYPQEDLDQLKKAQSQGLYPQEDLDQLKKAQGLYPQEDLDQLQEAQDLGLYPQEDLDQLKKTQSLGLYPQEDLDRLQEAQGLYPQEDLDQLQEAQGLYPQEDLDHLEKAQPDNEDKKQKASENIAARMGPGEQLRLLAALQDAAESRASVACYSLSSSRAKLLRGGGAPGVPDLSLLLLHNGRACEFMSEKSLIEATVAKLRSRIKFSGECSLQSKTDCEGFIVIPSFLKEYVQQQLAVFAENALKAILMTPGREYMIDKAAEADGAGSESHQYDAIVPVDFQASGVLERNKRWGGGLQQFLEMKHQLAISPLSNVTNYMSNVHFFRRYLGGTGIFGVSGTLGGPAEKAFLERQYQTACCSIPAHRQKKLLELPALQAAGGQAAWTQAVCGAAWRAADRGQAVLVICEDVKTAERLRAEMQSPGRKPRPITMYTISAKHNIEKQTFGQGHVIIATNLGGRGTDVHVEQEVNERGGLFVLLTYFPGSHRVERQVFGRTARKGNPGMVQMVLNQDHLAAAYRGQSVETMRQLREEFEVSRLHGMERNELSHVQTKEELFSTFCTFLRDFDKNYTQEERSDISEMKLKDVPACFKVRCRKLDYQAALNALKGSWALWLILHEEHIGQRPVTALRDGLLRDLERTAEQLLQGSSSSFYDYIEVAKSRTDMHRLDKEKSDYGALSYWQSAAESDPFYRAVALYNQAYITVNLRQSDYIPEAKRLLREADSAVDAYLSEASNTMMFCNFSVSKDFAPHHEDGNLQRQMKARMSVFRAWKGYIESALETLQKIESSKGQAITEESSVYGLSGDQDPVTTKELMVLHEFGLSTVFQVKKKPEFSIDALLCFCLGVLQVAAGVLVCTLSSGSASQFGLALINEGVSDMIQGVKGMIQGSFDWAEWAISKAISIGVSLAFGGLSRLRSAARAVGGGARGLATGARTCSAFTVKQCFKHAAKYAGQEMVKQVCVTTLNYVADKGLEALFKKVLREAFRTKVLSLIRANGPLDSRLTGLVCSGVPKTALELQSGGFRMDGGCEGEIRKSVEIMTRSIIPELMTDCTKIMKVVDRLSEVCGAIMQHVENDGLKLAMKCLDTTKYIILCKQIQDSFPSEDVINKNFVPRLLEAMSVLLNEEDPSDGRRRLADVKRLKDQLLGVVAESVSDSLVEACSRHMTSFMTKACVHKISSAAGGAVSNLLGRTDTHSFFHNQVHKHRLQEAARGPGRPPAEQQDLQRLAEAIGDQHRPATELDLYLLTQSPALQGRGLRLTVVDEHGRALTEDYYPGTDSSADDIELRLKRYPEAPQQTQGFLYNLRKRARGEQPPHRGHFELVGADGAVVPAYSEGQNCLYHAVAQATRGGAADLRAQVQRTLLQDLPRWAPALRLQRGYQQTLAASSRYAISGGPGGSETRSQRPTSRCWTGSGSTTRCSTRSWTPTSWDWWERTRM